MQLMDYEDAETILNNDSTQLLKNIQRNKKKIHIAEKKVQKMPENLPEIPKKQNRIEILKKVMDIENSIESNVRWKILPAQMSPTVVISQTEDLLNLTMGKTPAPMSTDAVEQVEKIMGKRSSITKIS